MAAVECSPAPLEFKAHHLYLPRDAKLSHFYSQIFPFVLFSSIRQVDSPEALVAKKSLVSILALPLIHLGLALCLWASAFPPLFVVRVCTLTHWQMGHIGKLENSYCCGFPFLLLDGVGSRVRIQEGPVT